MKSVRRDQVFPVLPYLTAILAAIGVTIAVYPGFMSYDSIHALREARFGVNGGTYPPFVSYVWRVFDWIWPGPTLMLTTQNVVFLLSCAHILRRTGVTGAGGMLAVLLIALAPPLLGPMLVVWKDVSVMASFAAAVAFLLESRQSISRRKKICYLGFSLLMTFSAMAFRFNAASAAVPLLVWWVWEALHIVKPSGSDRTSLLVATAGGVSLSIGIFAIVSVVNSYRFPTFESLAPNRGLSVVMSYDLVGISVFSGRSLFPLKRCGQRDEVSIDYIRSVYSPKHLNQTIAADASSKHLLFPLNCSRADLMATWMTAVLEEPGAYFRHRWEVFRNLIGLTDGPVFYPTHYGVDPNNLGVTFSPTFLTHQILHYIAVSSSFLYGRPWVYYVIGTAACFFVYIRNASYALFVVALLLSAYLYMLPQFFIDPAADLRYNAWAVAASMLCIVTGINTAFRNTRRIRQPTLPN